ncbi:recombination factor protein RarA [[Eubacterium] infirmum]|nr:recombination factor protein RarA [[Eubacterium] infirmum]
MNQHIEKISNEVKGVIKGKDEVISKLMMAMLAKGNVLLEDVPGVGKTTMALAFARAMGLDTKRVQFTPDTLPSDIIGFSVYDKETGELSYKEGAIVTNLLLADEINRTSSKTQAALLEAMEEKKVTVDGVTRVLPDPFIVLATENPAGSAGTQMLPNSQLDRFMVKLSIGYPDVESQAEILADRHTENPVDNVEQVVSEEELKDMIKNANEVYIAKSVYEYIAKLVQKTREHEMVSLGVSPRGALSLCQMAKAYAFVNSRDFVTPDDIRAVFADVCGHRLMLNSKARLNELSAENILADIIKDVDIPAAESFKKML